VYQLQLEQCTTEASEAACDCRSARLTLSDQEQLGLAAAEQREIEAAGAARISCSARLTLLELRGSAAAGERQRLQ
jgi:hypothetical protein